jgi:hypothetical protein
VRTVAARSFNVQWAEELRDSPSIRHCGGAHAMPGPCRSPAVEWMSYLRGMQGMLDYRWLPTTGTLLIPSKEDLQSAIGRAGA